MSDVNQKIELDLVLAFDREQEDERFVEKMHCWNPNEIFINQNDIEYDGEAELDPDRRSDLVVNLHLNITNYNLEFDDEEHSVENALDPDQAIKLVSDALKAANVEAEIADWNICLFEDEEKLWDLYVEECIAEEEEAMISNAEAAADFYDYCDRD